ncbi:MAG: diguanylate cyclase [Thermoanaerobaculia bacterium]
MSPTEVHGPGWAWWAPSLVAIAALGTAAATPALAPHGLFPEPLWLLIALLIAAVGAMHRPFGGGSLSLGALAVLPGFDRLGVAPVAWIAGLALVLAELALRFIESRRELPLPERRSATRIAAAVSVTIVGVVAAGAVDRVGIAPAALALFLTALAWVAPHGLLEALARRARREPGDGFLETMQPLLLDLCGLLLGALALALVRAAGPRLGLLALFAFTLLVAEAARNGLAASGSARRLDEAQKLRRAGVALAAGGTGLLAAAEQIRAECAALFSYSWFQLDLDLPGEERMSWGAAADESLSPGAPSPPSVPPALPGIHRRSAWQIVERPIGDSRALGRVRLWCDPRRLEPRALELLDGLLPQMAASLREALAERAAKIDLLTGTASRRVLEARLEESFARARDEGGSLALVLCDLDHFKRINDTYGHAAGDQALKAVAAVLLAPSRGEDLCARYGGEEFVLLFEETDGATALEIAERLRSRVEAIEFVPAGEPVELTMSTGVAAYPELAVQSPTDLLHLADQALYTAKHLGRNLCLLDIGQGRLRTPRGEIVDVAPEAGEVQAPVFFA